MKKLKMLNTRDNRTCLLPTVQERDPKPDAEVGDQVQLLFQKKVILLFLRRQDLHSMPMV